MAWAAEIGQGGGKWWAHCSGIHDRPINRSHGLVKSTLASKRTEDEQVYLPLVQSQTVTILVK